MMITSQVFFHFLSKFCFLFVFVCVFLTSLNINSNRIFVSGKTWYIREVGCDHNSATCGSPSTNFTERCATNAGGTGISPDECPCCPSDNICYVQYGLRRLLGEDDNGIGNDQSGLFSSFYSHSRSLLQGGGGGGGGGGEGEGEGEDPPPPTSLPPPPVGGPTLIPSAAPTITPTRSPTQSPARAPTDFPSMLPTRVPTIAPTTGPSGSPSQPPTRVPSDIPSNFPTHSPSIPPTRTPSFSPTITPSTSPSQVFVLFLSVLNIIILKI